MEADSEEKANLESEEEGWEIVHIETLHAEPEVSKTSFSQCEDKELSLLPFGFWSFTQTESAKS